MDCHAIRDDLLDVLYGEADEGARRRVSEHQRACGECGQELVLLRRLRKDLATWTLPSAAPPSSWRGRTRWLPLAAGLLIGVGGLFAGQVQTARLEARLQRLENRPPAAAPGRLHAASDTTLSARLEQRMAESESRQERRLAAELSSFEARYEARRRYDLAQVSAGLSYLEGQTGLQMARTTELMGHVLQAAQER